MSLQNKVALVTGASRGAGRGIAIELALHGAKVYITARSITNDSRTDYPNSGLDITLEMIQEKGGKAIAIACDHRKEEDINNLANKVLQEEKSVDILVNNAWAGYMNESGTTHSTETFRDPFWKQPLWRWDNMMNISPRAHFIISKLLVPRMMEQKNGMIVTTTVWDNNKYISNLPYDLVKQMKCRMMYDMSIELKNYNISCFALSLGWIRTERLLQKYNTTDYLYREVEEIKKTESTRYGGRAIVALASDLNIMEKTGKTLRTGNLAKEYNFTDIDGTQPSAFTV